MSRILNLLQARAVEADTVIFHKGDPAAEMYFIATGEVLVEIEPTPVTLSEGDFFGELALLHDAPRGATIRTVTQCRLLALEYDDFRALLASNPEMHDLINEVVEKRRAGQAARD